MATNADQPVVDDDKPVTEDDLRALKYSDDEVETTKVEDEPSEDAEAEEESDDTSEEAGQTDDQATEEEDDAEESADEPPAFVKEFDYIKGDTPEEYAKNLEAAYKNSTSEALRLKGQLDEVAKAPGTTTEETTEAADATPKTALELYAEQKLNEDIQTAYESFRKDYPQVNDPTEFQKFSTEVTTFSQHIQETQKRLASPEEVYRKAAISLGWEKKDSQPDSKEKLAMAAKDNAATGKTTSAPSKKAPSGPAISEAEIKANLQMYPGKTREQIIEELTPYHQ